METILTIMRGQKSLAFSFGDFDFMTINYVAATHSKDKVSEDYYTIMGFLTQNPLDYALFHKPILYPAASQWSLDFCYR